MAFLGFASQALDQSRREWEELFMQKRAVEQQMEAERAKQALEREKLNESRSQFNLRMALDAGTAALEREKFNYQQTRDTAELDYRQHKDDTEKAFNLMQITLDGLTKGNLNADAVEPIYRDFKDNGHEDLANILINAVLPSDEFTAEDAQKALDTLDAAPLGSTFSPMMYEAYARRVATDRFRMDNENTERFVQSVLDKITVKNEQARRYNEAQVTGSEGTAVLTWKRVTDIANKIKLDETTFNDVVATTAAQRRSVEALATKNEAEAEAAWDTITANLEHIRSLTVNEQDKHQLFVEVYDATVQDIVDRGIMNHEAAQIAVATRMAKIDREFQTNELNEIQKDWYTQQISESVLREEDVRDVMEGRHLDRERTQVKFLTDMVTGGHPEALRLVGYDMLRGLVGGEAADKVLDQLISLAQDNRDQDSRLVDANTAIAEAQADFYQSTLEDRIAAEGYKTDQLAFTSAHQEDDWLHSRELKDRADARAESQLALAWSQFHESVAARNARDAAAKSGFGPGASLAEARKFVHDVTGWDINKFNNNVSDLAALQRDISILQRTANGRLTSSDSAAVQSVVAKYEAQGRDVSDLLAELQSQYDTGMDLLTNGLSDASLMLLDSKYTPVPEVFGLTGELGEQLWSVVAQKLENPALFAFNQGVDLAGDPVLKASLVSPALIGDLRDVTRGLMNLEGDVTWDALMSGAESNYQKLVEIYGADALREQGITGAEDILRVAEAFNAADRSNITFTENAMRAYGVDGPAWSSESLNKTKTFIAADRVQIATLGKVTQQGMGILSRAGTAQDAQEFYNALVKLMSTHGIDVTQDPSVALLLSPQGSFTSPVNTLPTMRDLYNKYVAPLEIQLNRYDSSIRGIERELVNFVVLGKGTDE